METIEKLISEVKEKDPSLANRLSDAFLKLVENRETERKTKKKTEEEKRTEMFYC
jgi:hypothetical protein